MVQFNHFPRAIVFLLLSCSMANAKEPTSPYKIIDTKEHFFINSSCPADIKSEDFFAEECHCTISAKYVEINGHEEINSLLRPVPELQKYCDYNFEHGLDAEQKERWKPSNMMADPRGFQYNIQQEVSFISERFVNVVDYSYVYSGGAHGNTAMDSLLFDLKNNKQVDMALLIDPAKTNEANRAIQEALNAMPEGAIFDEFRNLENPAYIKEDSSCESCVYVLKDTGLYAVFQQYGVGPYSSGFIEVKLPNDVISSSYHAELKKD